MVNDVEAERIVDWFGEVLWRASPIGEVMQAMSAEERDKLRAVLVEGLTLTFRDLAGVPYCPTLPRRPWGETID